MKKPILILPFIAAFTVCSFSATAQSITPQVVASSGAHASGTNVQLSWTLGELAVTTLSGGGSVITQGFHQTYDIATLVEEAPDGLRVNVYPNPATDAVHIALTGDFPALSLLLTDMAGRVIDARQAASGTQSIRLGMEHLAKGAYILRLSSDDQRVLHSYRIVKQ